MGKRKTVRYSHLTRQKAVNRILDDVWVLQQMTSEQIKQYSGE